MPTFPCADKRTVNTTPGLAGAVVAVSFDMDAVVVLDDDDSDGFRYASGSEGSVWLLKIVKVLIQ